MPAEKVVDLHAAGRRPHATVAGLPAPRKLSADRRAARDRRRSHATASVVIPTLNEAANIAWVLERLPATVDEVVLVDGRSTDGTVEVARAVHRGIRVIWSGGRGRVRRCERGSLPRPGTTS